MIPKEDKNIDDLKVVTSGAIIRTELRCAACLVFTGQYK